MNAKFLRVAPILLLAFAVAASADVRVSTGVEVSNGSYGGTDDIEDVYLPIRISTTGDRLGISMTIPYLRVTAPVGTIVDPDGQPVPGSGKLATRSGLGDVIASLTVYDLYRNASREFALDLTGSVKLATADADQGLGTGENDLSVYVDVYQWLDTSTLFGSVGYRWRGEPAGVTYDDVVLGSVGGAWPAGEKSLLGIIFDYRTSALADADDIREITGFGSVRIGNHWYLEFYACTGFTDSSPDWGAGVSVTTKFRPLEVRDGR